MNDSDIEFVRQMILKEQKHFEIQLKKKNKKEMDLFKIHLKYELNKKLMRIGLFHRNINFLAIKYSFEYLSKTIKLYLKYSFIENYLKNNKT